LQHNENFEFERIDYAPDIYVSVFADEESREFEFHTEEATFFKRVGSGFEKVGLIRYRTEEDFMTKDDLLEMACAYCESAVEAIDNCSVHSFDNGDIYIEELKVCEDKRGVGYGKMILDWISTRSENTNIIFLTVEYSDDSLFEYYEKNISGFIIDGVKDRTMTFAKI